VNTLAAASPRASRTGPALWLVATQALALASILAWLLVAGFSFIASGPASGDAELFPRPLLWALWAYPVLPVVCSVAAWRAFRRRDVRRAVTWTSVQLVVILPMLAYVAYMASPVG
jgi:cytochrome bd-type quinol oxidase subunit 2